jgi:hypothetical protein
VEIIFLILVWFAALIGLCCVCFGMYVTVAPRLDAGTGENKLVRIDQVAISTIKLLHFGEISTPYPGLIIAFFGVFLFVAAIWFNFDFRKKQEVKALLDPILIETAKSLHTEFHRVIDNNARPISDNLFNRTDELVRLLFRLDPENGHAIYYAGEINRYEGHCLRSKDQFVRYLDVSDTLPESEKGGDISQSICYARARGYCRQRAGWIQYLLAHRIYWEALQEQSAVVRKEKLKQALAQLNDSEKSFSPSTFSSLIPTAALKFTLGEQIRLDAGDTPNPVIPSNPC